MKICLLHLQSVIPEVKNPMPRLGWTPGNFLLFGKQEHQKRRRIALRLASNSMNVITTLPRENSPSVTPIISMIKID